ncbi:MAG: leucine--tRNA ligase [Anaerolineales bacterium]
MYPEYNPTNIESKWQREWLKKDLYQVVETDQKPKYYCLDFFPYPSGEGLHVGHCRNYVPTDVLSRYKRMQGFNVLHPMGWDAFGEPTEQFAVTHGIHPRQITNQSTANYRRQMEMIGTSYDWSREIDSSNPDFYRWTQWFFLKLYKKGLAYRDTNWQWWCPTCQTTLSNNEAEGGVCWRGHEGVVKQEIPGWFFRITEYADDLLAGLDEIEWPEKVKTAQHNWIGRSEGWEIDFQTEFGEVVPVFTTRPETIFGVTFFCLAPEHDLVDRFVSEDQRFQVEVYQEQAIQMSEIDRLSQSRQVSGVFTGGFVFNPMNRTRIPVWVADYVQPTYGSGAVMGVPAHDQRDYRFAKHFDIPIRVVVAPEGYTSGENLNAAYVGQGEMINSGQFNGMSNEQGYQAITDYLEENHLGRRKINYRMRDWLISRQRYWGTPIPIVYCAECGETPVPEEELPVLLPSMNDFQPDGSGRSPLARLPEFFNTHCPICEGPAQRETDTMGGFACSSWYFLRFTSPQYHDGPFEPEAMRYWMPVDLYVGGVEHAVMHLLYARFWTHFLADEGLLPFKEPFRRLLNQGHLMGPDGKRMSKTRGNVITPDEVVAEYGADTLRMYGIFMAPFEQDVNWQKDSISGVHRFLNRIWKLYSESYDQSATALIEDQELAKELHRTIQKVTDRIEALRFNTMISGLMEFANGLSDRYYSGGWQTKTYHDALDSLMILLAPAAPFIAEELWHLTGHEFSIHNQEWPSWDPELVMEEFSQIPIQINGKLRGLVNVPSSAGQVDVEDAAFDLLNIDQKTDNSQVVKVIYVPGKIMNILIDQSNGG